MPANPMPPPPPLLPSQQALLCPSPWAVGVGHTARTLGGGGHKGKLIVARANSEKPLCTKARSHFSHSACKVIEKQRVDSWLVVLMIFNITGVCFSVSRSNQIRSARFLTYFMPSIPQLWQVPYSRSVITAIHKTLSHASSQLQQEDFENTMVMEQWDMYSYISERKPKKH